MNELELVRELGDETPLAETTELADARARLMNAVAAERARAPRRRPRRAFVLGTAAFAAAAVAAAAVVVSVKTPAGHPARRSLSVAHVTGAARTPGQVLERAAFVVLKETPATPRPDQFVYTKSEASDGKVLQSWLSVDGTHDMKIGETTIFGCKNGMMSGGSPGPHGTSFSRPCTPTPAFFPDMPTDPNAMLPYLEKTQGVRPGNLNDLAKTVGSMLDKDYLLPAQQAALYRFLAATQGITVHSGIKDAAGRLAIGVGWSFEGASAMLLFDPNSYAYLGTTTVGTQGQISGTALLETAIVDQAGQPPAPPGSI